MRASPSTLSSYAFNTTSGNFQTRRDSTYTNGVVQINSSPHTYSCRGNNTNTYNWILGDVHLGAEL